MTDMPAAAGSGRAPGRAEPGLIRRHDLMAALNRAVAEAGHDHLGARRQREDVAAARLGGPAGSGSPDRLHDRAAGPARHAALLAHRAGRGPGRGRRRRSRRGAAAGDTRLERRAMVDKVLSELEGAGERLRPGHRRPARAQLSRGRRAAHRATDQPAPGRPRDRGHPPRPAAAPAQAAAGRRPGRDPRARNCASPSTRPASSSPPPGSPCPSTWPRCCTSGPRAGRPGYGSPSCPSPGIPTPSGSSPSSPAATVRSPST